VDESGKPVKINRFSKSFFTLICKLLQFITVKRSNEWMRRGHENLDDNAALTFQVWKNDSTMLIKQVY